MSPSPLGGDKDLNHCYCYNPQASIPYKTSLTGPAALRGLARLNALLTLAAVKESSQVLVAGRGVGTVLTSKLAKKLFSLSGSRTSWSATGQVFFL